MHVVVSCIVLFLIQSSVFNVVVAQENPITLISLPYEVIPKIVPDCGTISALKRTCKAFNGTIHYDLLPTTFVKNISEEMCTKRLIHFAHTHQEKSFFHFFTNNSCEERKKAAQSLGWKINEKSTVVELMKSYRDIVAVSEKQANFENIFNNKIASNMFCLSNHINTLRDSNNNTALIWAAFHGNKDIVTLLIKISHIDPNIQNDFGNTALLVAAGQQKTDVVALLLECPHIDLDIQNDVGDTAWRFL